MKKTIWFDITNVPHVNFFLPFIRHFEDRYDCIFSLRDFAETKGLFEKKIGASYYKCGVHKGENKLKKFIGLLQRTWDLSNQIGDFDMAVGVGNASTGVIAKKRHKLSISFDDNDKSANWLYAPFSDLAFFPDCIPENVLRKQLFKKSSLYRYHGYKEDIYLADFVPDVSFLDELPFDRYVIVRAENLKAGYVSGTQSIVPELLFRLHENGVNVLFLPRYASDRQYAEGYDNVFIPVGAVNGLDACYYADAILTGAGTMAREAACLGVPAVSFYAGNELLTVDQAMVAQGKLFFSRDVNAIMDYLGRADKQLCDLGRCKQVQQEVFAKMDEIIALKG